MFKTKHTHWPASLSIRIDDKNIAVPLRVHQRARHYRLTFGATGPIMTVPPTGRLAAAQAFLERQQNWIAVRLKRYPQPSIFADGHLVPLRGVDHRIVATGKVRGTVEIEQDDEIPRLLVPGAPEHMPRRLTDWLKTQARDDLEPAVARYAAALSVAPKSVSVRGQTSRWGSCSSAGRLNFNWRLILAPGFVLDYVAAHEVAHMVEMNHSQAFWDTVARAMPDMERGRAWLKANGQRLMGYGAQPVIGLGTEAD